MASSLDDLRVLKQAEGIADEVWKLTLTWDDYARRVVGEQVARAADSVGANIAEAFGRYHYGEKLKFLYYARGSLYETKYWLNRALARQLIDPQAANAYAHQLEQLARRLNAFVRSIKDQRKQPTTDNTTAEPLPTYSTNNTVLFTDADLASLLNIRASGQSPISNPQSPLHRE
ncbi:MAG TPA: four helix bundle protein [Candidatus Sulfomarinibacteraceae bacterium]|nr:four helix bundle protein [Candidatus Sulfomarinibacteraceae bacterium]